MGSISEAFAVDSSQLNNIDLVSGSKTIKITDARLTGKKDQPMEIFYEGDNGKPYRPGKSMGRIIGYVWGDDVKSCIGHSMTLFRDPDVRFGSNKVGGIRISHMTGLKSEKSFPLLVKRGVMGNYSIKPLILNDAPRLPSNQDEIKNLEAAALRGSDVLRAATQTLKERNPNAYREIMTNELVGRLKSDASDADNKSSPAADDDDTFPGDRPSQNNY